MILQRFESSHRMSQAVTAGDLVFLAGQVAADPSQPVDDQTRQILTQIDRLLEAAGSSRTRLVSVNIYLADIADFAAMNAVWDAWVPAAEAPARATVEAKLAAPQYRVEIQAIAARN